MRKAAAVLLTALVALSFCACAPRGDNEENPAENTFAGVWISCYELSGMLEGGDFKNKFSLAAKKLSAAGITDAFVHVRAFGDSLFDSDYYPRNVKTLGYGFDIMRYAVDTVKAAGMRFHAWINPFRAADGSFNSPADEKVRRDIICGVREIVSKYGVDGIHFDDYFYPLSGEDVDEKEFGEYCALSENAVTKREFRTAAVTSLVFSVKNAVKSIDPEVIFSISPAADMDKNVNLAFADVPYWCETGAVDYIIPQLYFGFEYPDEKFRFDNLLSSWRAVRRADGVKLVIGLPSYKLGTTAAPDAAEWQEGKDVPARQVKEALSCGDVSGVCFFSYSSLFGESPLQEAALAEIKKAIKNTPR